MSTKAQSSELLNIKQAAQFLNVSEVSLRRWTASGKLACLRVGPKRERRFRREDLQAFLEGKSAASAAGKATLRPSSGGHVLLEGICIEHGSHLCCLYESDLGRVKLSVPFLNEGLSAGDLCFLVASAGASDQILKALDAVRRNLKSEIAQGNLVLSQGANSGRAMYDYFKNAFVEGTSSGGRSLRVVGDMAWALDKGLGVAELIDFELRYNQFLAHQFPVVSLCQYDARRFSGVAILDALKCHEDTFNYPLGRFLI